MENSRTVIGEGSLVRGNLSGKEEVVVFGRLEGEVDLQSTLFVEPGGVVKADVRVLHLVVSGTIVGDVHATECLEVTASGRVLGNATSPRIIMSEGAAVRGHVLTEDKAGDEAAARSQQRTYAARPTAAFKPAASRPSQAPARPTQAAPRPVAAPQRSRVEAADPADHADIVDVARMVRRETQEDA